MVSILVGVCCYGMAVVCAAASPHLPSGVARALSIPPQYSPVLLSCHATVSCRVCGVWVSVPLYSFVWWGSLVRALPGIGAGWGHRGWWGGMVSEGRAL